CLALRHRPRIRGSLAGHRNSSGYWAAPSLVHNEVFTKTILQAANKMTETTNFDASAWRPMGRLAAIRAGRRVRAHDAFSFAAVRLCRGWSLTLNKKRTCQK